MYRLAISQLGSCALIFLVFTFSLAPVPALALVNINTASVEELMTLTGIGEVYAGRIVEMRPFATIEEIMEVKGIGEATFNKIREDITVSGSTRVLADTSGSGEPALSAHSSATPLSTKSAEKGTLTVSAGRDRVGAVGSPLEFRAEVGSAVQNRDVEWNFGDGTRETGLAVRHTYEYPGEYVVVLSVSLGGGEEAVARVGVKVVDPSLSLSYAGRDRVEVRNGSGQEVNLYGRALVASEGVFIFPEDTIIRAGQSISFSSKVTRLYPLNVDEVSLRVLGGDTSQRSVERVAEEHRLAVLERLQARLLEAEQKKLAIQWSYTERGDDVVSEETRDKKQDTKVEENEAEGQSALVLEAVDEPAGKMGFWTMLKRFFLRKE